MKYLELLRLTLIKWNVAPLTVVVFLCYVMFTLIEYYKKVSCTLDPTSVGALFIFLGTIGGLLYKMYDSMQKNRAETWDEEDEQ